MRSANFLSMAVVTASLFACRPDEEHMKARRGSATTSPLPSQRGQASDAARNDAIGGAKGRDAARSEEKPIPPGSEYDLSSDELCALAKRGDAGDGEAALRLSRYYDLYARDTKKGKEWLTKAARAGNPTAQYNLGVVLLATPGRSNRKQAKFWLEEAAKNGFSKAHEVLKEEF
jgi:TPR repeat protein